MKRGFVSVCAVAAVCSAAATGCTTARGSAAEEPRQLVITRTCLERYGHPDPAPPGYRTALSRESLIRYDNARAACQGGRALSRAELAELDRAEQALVTDCHKRHATADCRTRARERLYGDAETWTRVNTLLDELPAPTAPPDATTQAERTEALRYAWDVTLTPYQDELRTRTRLRLRALDEARELNGLPGTARQATPR
ncbi:hypothetical protein G6045_23860 [Streptomyces sp. YC504]|uniref:Lipoprotein n=1 Tax=Streptomyces mesophilus TaxID=1775132 RepID=A0A6G4XML3_9ACTN|nr:hypothetical protein [Streptomyces mesophilus]NGO78668.1 hypothetical protein [Streptomyces mesophilus]